MNVLVTGSNGQLGSELKALIQHSTFNIQNDNFYFTDRDSLDITSKKAIEYFVETSSIDTIINCAAYTAVDKAEEDKVNADRVNHIATGYLAEIAKEKEIKMVHISTDYVFNGENYRPYIESDEVNPNSVYGQTKRDGEKALLEINPKHAIIIRTSWLYSSYGVNFLKTMLRLGKEKDELGVVFDQVGTPTYARDLAKAILEILPSTTNEQVEIYHYSNEGVLSWYDFAKEIMRMAKLGCDIKPIETEEYPTLAARPYFSLLNKVKIKKTFGLTIPYWKDSLDECLKKMGERK